MYIYIYIYIYIHMFTGFLSTDFVNQQTSPGGTTLGKMHPRMKAEGGEVKSHPVVSQLVWLKELDAHLQPLNKRLNKKIQKVGLGEPGQNHNKWGS